MHKYSNRWRFHLVLLFFQGILHAGCSQRLQLQPQASLSTQDELGEPANASRAGSELRVHSRAQTKPEQGESHDHSQLCQGELLTYAVPVDTHGVISLPACLIDRSLMISSSRWYLGPEEKGMKAWGEWCSLLVGSNRRGSNSWKRKKKNTCRLNIAELNGSENKS